MGKSQDQIALGRLKAAWRLFCEACDVPVAEGATIAEQAAIMQSTLSVATRSRARAFLACVDARTRELLHADEWAGGLLAGVILDVGRLKPKYPRRKKWRRTKR